MPKVKVRHAIIAYTSQKDLPEVAFRGAIVDLPQSEYDRLAPLGAIVAEDAELDRPGQLLTLPVAPTDEELIAWVIAATPSEVERLVVDRPQLAPRLAGVSQHVEDLRQYQDERLSAAAATAEGQGPTQEELHGTSAMLDENAGATPLPEGGDPGDPTVADENRLDEEQPNTTNRLASAAPTPDDADARTADTIVEGSVDEVSDFLSENPEWAQRVLDAEDRRSARAGRQPRRGVLLAAQAAAGHAG